MIVLNFGKSDWACAGSPSRTASCSENVIGIPEQSKLRTLEEIKDSILSIYDELSKIKPQKTNFRSYSSVEIQRPMRINDDEINVYMMWIDQRKDWILIINNRWIEGAGFCDEYYRGPFALNELFSSKILEAYRVGMNRINIKDVPRTSPSELERLALEGN